jgi:hypothetical protein
VTAAPASLNPVSVSIVQTPLQWSISMPVRLAGTDSLETVGHPSLPGLAGNLTRNLNLTNGDRDHLAHITSSIQVRSKTEA